MISACTWQKKYESTDKQISQIAKTSILPTTCFKQFPCSSRLASTFGKSLSAVFVASSNSGRDVESLPYRISRCDRRRSTVDKNCQNQPIRGYTRIWYTGTHFGKKSYKRSRTSLPSSPLLFIAFFTSHRSPLSERVEQATSQLTPATELFAVVNALLIRMPEFMQESSPDII